MKKTSIFRPRTAEVEAFQFNQDNDAGFLTSWTEGSFSLVMPADREDDPEGVAQMYTSTHGTWELVHYGDWIVRHGHNWFVLNPDTFEARYEAV